MKKFKSIFVLLALTMFGSSAFSNDGLSLYEYVKNSKEKDCPVLGCDQVPGFKKVHYVSYILGKKVVDGVEQDHIAVKFFDKNKNVIPLEGSDSYVSAGQFHGFRFWVNSGLISFGRGHYIEVSLEENGTVVVLKDYNVHGLRPNYFVRKSYKQQ